MEDILIQKVWAMPNGRTFTIPPIKKFVESYVFKFSGGVIVDPFANECKYGTLTNDLNPEYDTTSHVDALKFLEGIESESVDMVLYDPPYSITQASMKYWELCKDNVARILKRNGVCLSFGWNSNGLGKNRGFEMTEILLVAHGGSKNDTICCAEFKL